MSYGSLQNMFMNEGKQETIPVIGMGATEILWTDRKAYTIIDISPTGKTITLQRDEAIRIDDLGMTDSQQYRYERDTEGSTCKARKNKEGKWKVIGTKSTVRIGSRNEYYDYSF